MSGTVSDWQGLSATMTLRRHLQGCLCPVSIIGSKCRPDRFDSYEAFKRRIGESRLRASAERAELLEQHGIKSTGELEQKIEEVWGEEDRLWVQCRPDLYPTEAAARAAQ